ncbi:hypothetical protein GCM10028803_53380 [Larkinella knui]|uniref:Uncharacterized protein n=1 Tax=Larkinella knui TaxID=2025310 RepID=A0A3P1CGS1_9BACT|nr:hypothetical protein [Larkinella knui]RRB12455.1 hypothetical protein EHT87_19850 [Larkinella knui]
MKKPTFSVGKLLSKLFPQSHKAISEKLSTEEYNAFAAEAGVLEGDPEGEVIAATVETVNADVTDPEATSTPAEAAPGAEAPAEPAVPEASEMTSTHYQARIQALENQVTQLTADRTTAQNQVTDLQAQLQQKEGYITKLKASVNPLAEADASNGAGDGDGLTDTDRQARANAARFKQTQS